MKSDSLIGQIRRYWNTRIHDLEMTDHPIGSREFFVDLDEYRFDKLRYLPEIVQFDGFTDNQILEVGCGVGTDLVRFAKGGAYVTSVDLAERSIELAALNTEINGVNARVALKMADGEALPFSDDSFDLVYCHGVIQYTAHPAKMLAECRRVLKPGGQAIFMVYNRISWLNILSKLMRVELEHGDAPVLRKFSIGEYRRLLGLFREVRIVPERFPVPSRLHKGWKGIVFNKLFVGVFNRLPRSLVRSIGWHLMAFC